LVTDKSGNHIAGLKKEDFTVFENGSGREVATFEEITSNPHLAHPRNPNEFTNFAGAGITPRITVILLDLINTPFPDQAYMRNQLLKYVSQSLDRREPTGLFTLDQSGVHVIHVDGHTVTFDLPTVPGFVIEPGLNHWQSRHRVAAICDRHR
jgi:VWFA-related protein